MHSSLLANHGLRNQILGSDYDFRYQKVGKTVEGDVQRALKVMDIRPKEIYTGQQTHSANVVYADGKNGEAFAFGKTFKNTDGLITDQPGVALLVKYADCTPVVLFDPIKRVQASVHSGWRGTTQQISLQAIEKMVNEFHCKREDILAYLGPSIDLDHYEVGTEVYEAFSGFKNRDQFFRSKEEKYQLSMLDANLDILKQAGIKPEQVEVERTSTYLNANLHSARQEGPEYGLNAIVTMIPE